MPRTKTTKTKSAVKKVAKKVADEGATVSACRLEVKVNDVHFKTNAPDFETALTEFVQSPEYPLGAKTTAIISYAQGANKGTRVLHPSEARRTFKAMSLKGSAITILAYKLTSSLNA